MDLDELWNGEATVYLVTCPDITDPGHCKTRRIVFRASAEEQSVLQLYNNAPPFRLIGDCVVRGSHDWQCKTLKSGNYTRSMTDGHYQSALGTDTIDRGTWKLKWVIYSTLPLIEWVISHFRQDAFLLLAERQGPIQLAA